MNIIKYYTALFLSLLLAFQTHAQLKPIETKIIVSMDSVLIGDHVKLSYQVTYDTVMQKILLPEFKDKIGNYIEIIEKFNLDTISRQGSSITVDQSMIVTAFDAGTITLSAQLIALTKMQDSIKVDSVTFPNTLFYVNTIPIDTTTYQMYNVKGLAGYSFVIWDYWWVGAIILGLALIAFGIWWYIRWRNGKGIFDFSKPKEPPHIIAFTELQKLKSEKLWEQDKTKLYYTRLTDIIRQYLDDMFGVQAMEKTSDEILQALSELKFDKEKRELYEELKSMFMYADLAKFAKYNPSAIENERSYMYAYNFIDATKPEEIVNNETTNLNTQDDNNTSAI